MRHAQPPSLIHAWLGLRPMEIADAPAWFAQLCLPGMLEHSSWRPQRTEDLLPQLAQYQSSDPATPSRWAIVDRRDGQLIGSAGFHSLDLPHRRAELAYDLGIAHWGQGIGTLVARALGEFGLNQLGYHRVQATVLDSNLASRRVLEKAGFTYEGLLHHYRLVRGEPRDFLSYARWA